jgi:hypothetical protein
MANVYATKTGNWSDITVWNTGALPTSSDDVYANGFTVTVNQVINVLSIRTQSNTGINAGGGFTLSTAYNGTADIYAGTTACLTYTANGCNWIGNCNGGSASASYGINNNSSGTFTITGNCNGGSSLDTYGVNNNSSGTVNITGNCNGGSGTGRSDGARNNSSGTVNITGNCNGGSGVDAHGARNNSSGTVNITGNCNGGSATSNFGTQNTSIGIITIIGNSTGGIVSGASGANNASTGTLTVTTATASSSTNILAAGVNGAVLGGITRVKNIIFGSAGQTPISGYIRFENGTDNTANVLKQNGTTVALSDPLNVSNLVPAIANVRSGITYNNGTQTGTLIVPSPSNVVKDVATDNTVGTYSTTPALIATEILTKLLSGTDFNTVGSFGKLLKDNVDATVSSRLATSGYTTPPTAIAIRSEIDTNSTKLDATVGSRLASSSYTAPPTASSIRAEIDSNSTKLDVTVSSRLATSGYTAPNNSDITAIKAKTDILVNTDLSLVALESTSQSIKTKTDSLVNTDLSLVSLESTSQSIKTKTDMLVNTDLSLVALESTSQEIKTKVDALENTDLSLVALESTSQSIKDKTDTLVNTDLTGIALESTSQEIKTKVDALENTDITGIEADLIQMNEGLQLASILVPYTLDL